MRACPKALNSMRKPSVNTRRFGPVRALAERSADLPRLLEGRRHSRLPQVVSDTRARLPQALSDVHVPQALHALPQTMTDLRVPQALHDLPQKLGDVSVPQALHGLPHTLSDLHVRQALQDLPRPHVEFRRPARRRKRGFLEEAWPYLLAALVGAVIMYLLDPYGGRRRRALARDKTSAVVRRSGREVAGAARGTAAGTRAAAAKATHPRFTQHEPDDDVTLLRKVESELFRNDDVPKGELNISVEYGTVVLRGQVDGADEVALIEKRVRRVVGVHEVQNLLHMAGTPAPNKQEAREHEFAPNSGSAASTWN